MTKEVKDRLRYLDLELSQGKKGGTIDHLKIACFHQDKDRFKHFFHTEGKAQNNLTPIYYQQNCIADLCYTTIYNLASLSESLDIRTESFLNLHVKHRQKLDSLIASVSSLSLEKRNQKTNKKLEDISTRLEDLKQSSQRSYLSKLPTREDLEKFLLAIDQEPKKIEQETIQLAKDLSAKVVTLEQNIDRLENLISKLDRKLDILMS